METAPDYDLLTVAMLLFVTFSCVSALTAWFRPRFKTSWIVVFIYALVWVALTVAFGYIAQPLYGFGRAASVSGLAAAATLVVVYLVAPHNRVREAQATVASGLRVIAGGLAGTVLLPVLLLTFVTTFGIDGP